MMKETVHVEGMTCQHCKAAVEGALRPLSGVNHVEVDLDKGHVHVTYEQKEVTRSEIDEAIIDQGYDVTD